MLFSRTAPADRAAVVLLVVNRNASFDDAVRVAQADAAVDFIAARIRLDGRRVAEVFRAVAVVAVFARIHPLAFVIRFALEHACGQLFHFIIWFNGRRRRSVVVAWPEYKSRNYRKPP